MRRKLVEVSRETVLDDVRMEDAGDDVKAKINGAGSYRLETVKHMVWDIMGEADISIISDRWGGLRTDSTVRCFVHDPTGLGVAVDYYVRIGDMVSATRVKYEVQYDSMRYYIHTKQMRDGIKCKLVCADRISVAYKLCGDYIYPVLLDIPCEYAGEEGCVVQEWEA